jgi:hypothetical protein
VLIVEAVARVCDMYTKEYLECRICVQSSCFMTSGSRIGKSTESIYLMSARLGVVSSIKQLRHAAKRRQVGLLP